MASCERIHEALTATGLSSKYLDRFAGGDLDDVQVNLSIKKAEFNSIIRNVIDSPVDCDLFISAFSNPDKYRHRNLCDELEWNSNENISITVTDFDKDMEVDGNSDSGCGSSSSGLINHNNELGPASSFPDPDTNSTSHRKQRPFLSQSGASATTSSVQFLKSSKKSVKAFTSHVFSSLKRSSTFSKADSDSSQSMKSSSTSLRRTARRNSDPNSTRGEIIQDTKTNHSHLTKIPGSVDAEVIQIEPVQIIDIPLKTTQTFEFETQQRNIGTENTTTPPSTPSRPPLIFHRDQLELILSKIGPRPVALLSIAGPSRQGKSFILGYMLRFLQSISKTHSEPEPEPKPVPVPDSDWMGKGELRRNEPLVGGFKWRSGVERETTGIWMWPEPFTLKAPDGTEFDVLLVDTQGVFDDYTDKKDWATIVGLSLLTSSCLIFNIMNNLQEDSLITLKDFMDFGLLAKNPTDGGSTTGEPGDNEPGGDRGGDRDEKPFQKLVFLIRDWNNPDDYPFGASGGGDFLRANLARKNTKGGAEIRTQIKQCFEQLDCFLMPEPGPAVKRKTYDGSVAKMDPEFASNVENFIQHIFHPSKFPPKSLAGNLVTGGDLLLFFEQYVKIFNSDQMPSPQDMNQASALICNQTIQNKLLTSYEQSLKEFRENSTKAFLLDSELQEIHESLLQYQVLTQFQKSRKMGSAQDIAELKSSILQKVDNIFKLVSAQNMQNQEDGVRATARELEEFFPSLVEGAIVQTSSGPDNFVLEDTLESLFVQCEAQSLLHFKGLLGLDFTLDLESLPRAKQTFESILCSLKKPIKLNNLMRKSDMETHLKEETTKLSIQYKARVENSLAFFQYWTQGQIQTIEVPAREHVFTEFNSVYKDSCLSPTGRKHLTSAIQKEFEDVQKLVQMQNKNFLMSLGHLVSELTNNYTNKMEDSARENYELGTTHNGEKRACLATLEGTSDFDRLPPTEAERFSADLSTRIHEASEHLIDKWFPRIRQRLIKSYKDRINDFYGGGGTIFEEIEIVEEHDRLKSEVLDTFKKFVCQIPLISVFQQHSENPTNNNNKYESEKSKSKIHRTSSTAKTFQDFEQEIDNYVDIILERNALRAEAVFKTVRGFLYKAKGRYLKLSKEINEACHPVEIFQKVSDRAKKDVLQFFEDQCKSNLTEKLPLKPSFLHLQEFMSEVPQLKMADPSTLEISGPSLKFSRELCTLDNIQNQTSQGQGPNGNVPVPSPPLSNVKEVRWRAGKELFMDENLCGEFWSGKNVSVYTQELHIVGNQRLIIVSGENGRDAPQAQPPTPQKPGANGIHGSDGHPGESGGNVLILAQVISKAENLLVISNGGSGGNGQPGGSGSSGVDGISGDKRFSMSLAELELTFPSPAKFIEIHVKENRRKAITYLEKLAEENGMEMEKLPCINSSSRCYVVNTKEGASFRYGFFQGGAKGLVSGRSFYIWFQGAPGTLGQIGGYGGLGGRGGNEGYPGSIDIPLKYSTEVQISRKPGIPGVDGRRGNNGKSGINGAQGTDFALIDPYAGLYVPDNFISKKRFSGRLEMKFAKETKSSKSEAAYCPHEKEYISFVNSINMRDGVKVYEDPVPVKPELTRKPLIKSRAKNPILENIKYENRTHRVSLPAQTSVDEHTETEVNDVKDYMISCDEYTEFALSPTPIPSPTISISNASSTSAGAGAGGRGPAVGISGIAGDFQVRDSELQACIQNGRLEPSVIDTYASILCRLHPNAQVTYVPSSALSYRSNSKYDDASESAGAETEWRPARDVDSLLRNALESASPLLTSVVTILSMDENWILLVADLGTGKIGIADTLGGYFSPEIFDDGIAIFARKLNAILGNRKWEAVYLAGIQVIEEPSCYNCGPAALYLLEELYLNSELNCNKDKGRYEIYRKTIVERILLTTDEGRQILECDNEYTNFLDMC